MSRYNRCVRTGRRPKNKPIDLSTIKLVTGEIAAFPESVMVEFVTHGFDVALCSCGDDLPGQVIGVYHPTRVKDGDTMTCPRCKAVLRFVLLTREEADRDAILDGNSVAHEIAADRDRKHPGATHLAVLRGPNGERIEPKLAGMEPVN